MAISVVVILICAAAIAFLAYRRATGVVYRGTTAAGWTTIHNDRHVMGELIRVLEVEGTYQSATYLDERWAEPVFPYHRLFDHLFDAWPAGVGPQRVAILGGGGYALPKHLVAHHPEIVRIDVVEIDPAIERLARRYFFLDRLEARYHAERSGRLHLHVDDALDWLGATDQHFDVIINDCFSALEPEASLMTPEGVRRIAERLEETQGLYLTNVVSALEGRDAGVLYQVIASLRQHFAHIWVYPCSPNRPHLTDNNVVIATNATHCFDGAWEWPEEERS